METTEWNKEGGEAFLSGGGDIKRGNRSSFLVYI
jgi:hypothetical protein